MNQMLTWLSGGDLRSDAMSNTVADFVLQHPELFEELIEGLDQAKDLIRGRSADAVEKVARSRPDLLLVYVPKLIDVARTDRVPMVKMHIAMTLGHLALYEGLIDELTSALLELLADDSVFVKSWAVASLCIVARQCPRTREEILVRVAKLQGDPSVAVRARVRKALPLLTDQAAPFPKGWIKSDHLQG